MSKEPTYRTVAGFSYAPYPSLLTNRPVSPSVLSDVLANALQVGQQGVVVFDLDATLLDNRTRQAFIVREFGREQKIPELMNCLPDAVLDWSLTRCMIACGLPAEKAENLDAILRDYWFKRFFTSEYCFLDIATPGAADYLRKIQQTKVHIAYCTGRHNAMAEGTVACMKREGFPIPDGKTVHLITKPNFEMSDDDFKEQAYTQLHQLGTVIAAFDNEPTHINSYHREFPNAISVHLLTMESGRGVPVLSDIPSISDFLLPR